jgi:tRNA(His) guanylyltransferase
MLDIEKRFKRYELVTQYYLTKRTPVIIRVDGSAFHTFTKYYWGRGYSENFAATMCNAVLKMMPRMQGVKFVYTQSDEASFLLTDYDDLSTDAWFGYEINKLVSISAGMMTAFFNDYNLAKRTGEDPVGWFDARAFNLPKEEVVNYFVWRQQDAIRNSKSMLAREYFSQKQLTGKNCDEMCKMLYQEKQVDWFALPHSRTYGLAVHKKDGKWFVDEDIPLFTNREFIGKWID